MKTKQIPSQNTALQLAQESFLVAKESEGLAPLSLVTYRRITDKFVAFLLQQDVTTPDGITPTVIRSYFTWLTKQGYTQHTIHDNARPVKTMLRFWHYDGLVDVDIMARVKMPQACKEVQPAFTEDEVKMLLRDGCKSERDKALLAFMLDVGVRAQELCDLKVSDVDIKSGAVVVEHGKGDKKRTAFMGAKCKRQLLKYLMTRGEYDDDSPLFPSQTNEHLTTSGLFQLLKRIGDRAGITDCHPHKCRRTMAINCLRAGMSIFMLAKLLGHSDISVLRHYLSIQDNDLQDAVKQHGALDYLRV